MIRRTARPFFPTAEACSISVSLFGSVLALFFFSYLPNYVPEHHPLGLPGWSALGYVAVQLWMILDLALDSRPRSTLEPAFAITPVVTGLSCSVLWGLGWLHLSDFQVNVLAITTITAFVGATTRYWMHNWFFGDDSPHFTSAHARQV
jgi:hypothetical protein